MKADRVRTNELPRPCCKRTQVRCGAGQLCQFRSHHILDILATRTLRPSKLPNACNAAMTPSDGLEAVTGAADRADGIAGPSLQQRLAQSADMHVHRASIDVDVYAPDAVE